MRAEVRTSAASKTSRLHLRGLAFASMSVEVVSFAFDVTALQLDAFVVLLECSRA